MNSVPHLVISVVIQEVAVHQIRLVVMMVLAVHSIQGVVLVLVVVVLELVARILILAAEKEPVVVALIAV